MMKMTHIKTLTGLFVLMGTLSGNVLGSISTQTASKTEESLSVAVLGLSIYDPLASGLNSSLTRMKTQKVETASRMSVENHVMVPVPDTYATTSGKSLSSPVASTPVPASVWLPGVGLIGIAGIARRKRTRAISVNARGEYAQQR